MYFYELDCLSKNQLGFIYIVCLKKIKKKICNICKVYFCYLGLIDILSILNERYSSFVCEYFYVYL